MDPKNEHFHYPYGLYSAGHAYLDIEKSHKREPIVQERDRENTILVGDSGGFQAATGVLDFDWSDPMGEKANNKRMEILRWLEHTADYSMILDWPAWAINTGRLPQTLMICDPTTNPLQVTNNPFKNCLNGTIWNNEFFMKHREPGATKFLNVLQGRNIEEAYEWYDAVTPFSNTKLHGDRAFEGWALGGSTGGDPSLTMRLLIKLRDDGYLDGDDRWIHVLGRSRLTTAAYLTSLNKALKAHVNENCQISFDAASAFLYSVNGHYLTDWQISPKGMNVICADIPMHEKYIDSKEPFIYDVPAERLADPAFFHTPVSKMLTMGDIILAPNEKSKKPYSMDTASYYYLMAHNVQLQVNAINDVCSRLDTAEGKKTLPLEFQEYDDFINRLFQSETPFTLIEQEGSKFRDLISGERPGVSALEDQELFPKTTGLEDLKFDPRQKGKTVKEVKTLHSFFDDIIVKPNQANG